MPQINDAGLRLIESFEGCVLYAYDDANDKRIMPGDTVLGTLTIGWGHTGSDVHPGQTITQTEADNLLERDLVGFEIAVNNMVTHTATPNAFAALVSFAYNDGAGALHGSTLLRDFNAGNIPGAAAQFGLWIHANGQVSEGLIRRRAAEKSLFLTP